MGDHYQSELALQKQRTRQVLSAAQTASRSCYPTQNQTIRRRHCGELSQVAAAAETTATVEDSLSKVKLRNAVDLANALLLDPKQQKRVLQQLIDADEHVIDEERVAQEQTAHKLRLASITSGAKQREEFVRPVSASPWQQRNWRAAGELQRQRVLAEQNPTDREPSRRIKVSSSPVKKTSAGPTPPLEGSAPERVVKSPRSSSSSAPRFRSIETVEQAAQDALTGVNAHDLLVRCAEVRQHADSHTAALAQYRDRFLDDEAAWELMRQAPANVVRKHLARRLYQHAQEVQIGSTQIFYSPLFSND